MKIIKKYSNSVKRAKIIEEQEAKGLTMLHDNFIKGWQRGDPPAGTLIFTDEPRPEAEPVRDLYQEIIDIKARLSELETREPLSL